MKSVPRCEAVEDVKEQDKHRVRRMCKPLHEYTLGESVQVVFKLIPPPYRGLAKPPPSTIVRMPACHSRRFKGERPIGAATG